MTAKNRKRIEVAAGVIVRDDGRFLLGQRAADTFYPGYWEFPGGKVEPGESPAGALCRELHEELGIRVESFYPWIVRVHEYEHASVRLHFFEVTRWRGNIRDHVHAALAWIAADEACTPMLPANGPVFRALALPRRMGITQAAAMGVEPQLAALSLALAGGLRLVQLREAGLPASERRAFAVEAVRRAHAARARALVNDDPELALAVGADGLHLPAARLMASVSRPGFAWVGASCHDRVELEHAAALGLDYALLGPVKATATHPAGVALGWARFAALAAGLPLSVFALGGLADGDMETARRAGAHGVAAIRAAWGGKG
ncbi:MAG: Nudix family hydrolase [Azoarcus sp.]|jgi:8-oxo-dGTP diphosphatase|nr:Nudix family hydrolase [Azoarcus sp.]